MKIAEETGDSDMKEVAKVNFGMANASMKWTNHVTNILQNIEANVHENVKVDEFDDDDEREDQENETPDHKTKLPEINKR